MMDQIFKFKFTKRIFIFNGYTKDQIALSDGRLVRFDQLLHQYLTNQEGYERVILIDHEGVYFWDQQSAELMFEKNESNTNNQSNSNSGLKKRKLNIRVTPDNKQQNNQSNRVKFRHPKLNNIPALHDRIKHWMRSDIDTAVIYYNDSYFENKNFRNSKSFNHFTAHLKEKFGIADAGNMNVFIFVYNNEHNLSQIYENRGWSFLYKVDDGEKKGEANYKFIGLPGKDEIRNLFNRKRILGKKEVQLEKLPKILNDTGAFLKGSHKGEQSNNNPQNISTLAELNGAIGKVADKIDEDLIVKLGGISSDEKSGLEKLDQLIGMDALKEEIRNLINNLNQIKVDKKTTNEILPSRFSSRRSKEFSSKNQRTHLILRGNPGTGKTTVAKYIGQILREHGILETGHVVEVGKKDLVSKYVGATAIKTTEKIEQALGGVLFIDEAYSLAEGNGEHNYGQESLATIVKAMTQYAGQLVIIMAGYPRKMKKLYQMNPGLKSRVKDIKLPDYNGEDLAKIFEVMVNDKGLQLAPEVKQNILNFTTNLYKDRQRYEVDNEGFGNARVIENILDDAKNKARQRVENDGKFILKKEDFSEVEQDYFNITNKSQENCLQALDEMVGLEEVRQEIKEIKNDILIKQQKRKQGIEEKITPKNYIFKGNPGTGKTTVANLIADQLYDLGVLESNYFASYDASQLTATKNPQREIKEKIDEVIEVGGLLFIDEAHQLHKSPAGHSVLDALLSPLSKYKNKFSLVIAGYPQEIDRMINNYDPGLLRRFYTINFRDFTLEELVEIFHYSLNDNYQLEEGFDDLLKEKFKVRKKVKGRTFENAGVIDKLLEEVKKKSHNRIAENEDEDYFLLKKIDLERVELD